MTANQRFSKRLKDLRGRIPVKELAKRNGVAETAIYKAEGGERSVAWKTVENCYGDLCPNEEQYADLLMLWAMTQSERRVGLYAAQQAMSRVREEISSDLTQETEAVIREVGMMGAPEQREFAVFAKHFRRSPYTRDIARVWVESSEGWLKEIQGGK